MFPRIQDPLDLSAGALPRLALAAVLLAGLWALVLWAMSAGVASA